MRSLFFSPPTHTAPRPLSLPSSSLCPSVCLGVCLSFSLCLCLSLSLSLCLCLSVCLFQPFLPWYLHVTDFVANCVQFVV